MAGQALPIVESFVNAGEQGRDFFQLLLCLGEEKEADDDGEPVVADQLYPIHVENLLVLLDVRTFDLPEITY